jgi:alpha-D-ribose 1-methylphosphonate 5-triphosphate synthase subunit PhnI
MSIIKNDFPSHYRAVIADLQRQRVELECKVYDETLANIALRHERDELLEAYHALKMEYAQVLENNAKDKKAS